MPSYTTADIKALRERTGAGMLDVKKALDAADGDMTKAVEFLRVKGLRGVTKREGRSASNGLVAAEVSDTVGVIVEVNCETDFVAKGDRFRALADRVLKTAVGSGATDAAALTETEVSPGTTVAALLDEGNATLGEKIELRRVARLTGEHVTSYLHRTSPDLPPQIGVLLAVSGAGDDGARQAARDVALHIAAMSPTALRAEDIDPQVLATERRLAEETAREEGKPEAAMPKIVEGRVRGYLKENVLLEQAFTKDNKKVIGAVLKDAGLTATGFVRFRVGS